jgi:Ca2+-binding RTX toxin-like protein
MSAEIQKLYIAYFNRPADPGGLAYWTDQLAKGATMSTIANSFSASAEYQAIYAGKSNLVLIDQLYQNLFGRTADVGGLLFWSNEMLAGRVTITTVASALSSGTTAGSADNIAINSKIAAATAFTAAIDTAPELLAYSGSAATAQASAWLSTVTTAATLATAIAPATLNAAVASAVASSTVSAGSTFTLTTGIDNFPGTAGNDIFQGDSANIGGLDRITGGNGTDTLALSSTAAAVTLSSAGISGVEVLTFTAATAGHTVTLGGLAGITNVNNSGSTQALTVGVGANSLASLAAIGVSNTATATTVVYQEAAVTGSSDAVTVTLSGGTGAVNVDTETNTSTVAGAIETINIVSSGTTNSTTLETNDAQGLGTINVSGSVAISITLGTNAATDAIVLNASAATGNVTITNIGAGNTFAGVATGHTITGGSGDDTFTFTAGYIGAAATVASGTRDVINGGSGNDTLNIVLADAVTASATAQANLTSIERLRISDAWATGNNLDITRFADVRQLTLAAATAGTSTATLNSGTTVVLAGNSAANSVTSFTVGGVGTTDSVTLNMAGFDFAGTGTETFNGVETLNINTGATVTDAATFADAITLVPSAGATTGIVVTGNNAMTFTGVVTAASINATALTGILTVTAAPANAVNIIGGSAADVITGSTAADSITGGNGADTITSGTGADSIVLTETVAAVDTIVTTEGAAPATATADVITGFTVGASGDILQIDISDTTAIADVGIVAAGDGATAIAGNLVLRTMTAGTGITLAATDEAVVINSGTFANAAALIASIGTGAGIITKSAANTTTNGLIVVWVDTASNTHVSVVSDAGADAAMTSAQLVVTDIAVLVGVLTDFNTVNLAAIA